MRYISTRGNNGEIYSAEAIVAGLAKDGGLFVPESFPEIDTAFIQNLVNLSYIERAEKVLELFLSDFYAEEIADCVTKAYGDNKFDSSAVAPVKMFDDINVLEPFQVPALILQPIVENAIRHGLYQKLSGGQIIITIDKRKGYYRITVQDDGLGISPERLKYIFDTSIPKKSIGLTNVNQRLIALYGPKNHLKIFSRVDKGTIVIMKIPFQEVTENND